jgi:glycosyltransferase involved in cell wall biosynthesis
MKVSIVSAVYKAERIVDELVRRCRDEISSITSDYEIILVEDGSPDNSWEKIASNCTNDSKVKGIKLSRNFGQHYAITAGLQSASGDVVILLDCDLQDNPKYFSQLIEKYEEGYDVVFTEKDSRKHSWFKNVTASIFSFLFNFLVDQSNSKSSKNMGAYSLLSRKVVDAFVKINDYRRHYLMIVRWLGFKSAIIKVEHDDRLEGSSSYNLIKLINHAIDGLTSQSDKILKLTVIFGFLLSILAFMTAIYIIGYSLLYSFLPGWASLSVLILFVGGLIITSIGISGIYIGKIFEQTKQRPLFLVDKKINI